MTVPAESVADRERLRSRLASSEAQFQALIERNADGMLVVNEDGLIQFCNPAGAEMLGNPQSDLTGQRFGVPLVPGESTEINLLHHGQPERVAEMRVTEIDWHGSPALLATLRDISDRKQAEEKVREAVELRDRFLAMLSHELRNPLAAILNASRLLQQTDSDASMRPQAEQVVLRQAEHISRLLDDLLDVSRASRGKIDLRREVVDLRDVAEDAVISIETLIAGQEHELITEYENHPAWVDGDTARLRQVIANLLANAAKYTPRGGRIWLHIEHENDAVAVRVRDNGMGIAPAMQEMIFDLFVQSDETLDRADGGLGIGLTLVKTLVEIHGGTIKVRSDGPGRGSEFIVRLPTHELCDHQSLASPGEAGAPDCYRILLVDDNDDYRVMLQALLELEGHTVYSAADGLAGLDALAQHRPEVALVDIGLPGIDGYELARRARREAVTREIPLVALTGYGRQNDRNAALEAGFEEHLVKPLDMERLAQALADLPSPTSNKRTAPAALPAH